MLSPVVTSPTNLPITLKEVRDYAIVDLGTDDAVVERLVKAAVGYLDGPNGVLGRAVMPQVVVQKLPCLNGMTLPYGPLLGAPTVTYLDADGAEQAFTDFYTLKRANSDEIRLNGAAPTTLVREDAVTVTYQAGWTGIGDVPESLKQVIAMMVATWYDMRHTQVQGSYMPTLFGVEDLIAPLRRVRL